MTYPHQMPPRWIAPEPSDPGSAWSPVVFKPHVVYELWQNGECLYVGISSNLEGRLRDHRKTWREGQWWDEVRTTAVSDRRVAEGLERRLIFILRPKRNKAWNPDQKPWLLRLPQWRVLVDAAA